MRLVIYEAETLPVVSIHIDKIDYDSLVNSVFTGSMFDDDDDDDCFYIVLFSALEQTHCTCM